MTTAPVLCPILGASITRVVDDYGRTVHVGCDEFSPRTRVCALKAKARRLGVLHRLLQRASGDPLDTQNIECCFCSTEQSRPS